MSNVGFGFDENTQETTGSKFIQITPETAIKTGRFIKELKFDENNGNAFFEIIITNVQGQTAQRRYYEPKVDGNIIKNDDDLKKSVTKFNGVMANLSRKFLGDSYKPQNVTDFASLCKVIIKDIGNKYVNKELRIKLVLNEKNFPTLPTYAPIFENIETTPSKLDVNVRFDKVISTYKPSDVKPDADKPISFSTQDPSSGLPF